MSPTAAAPAAASPAGAASGTTAPRRPRARRPLRVAIVGLGPKGLFALERLLAHAAAGDPAARIEVDAFDPHPVPGAGPVYDPRQPAHLLMNFAADQIDISWPAATARRPPGQLSFAAWSAAHGRPCDGASYPPRADVGRYLADGLRALLAAAPANVRVTIRPARVAAICRDDSGWCLGDRLGRYDEVLLATGHETTWSGSLAASWTSPTPLAAAVFPVDRWLSTGRIPPGAKVAVRGFALSFIDAALTLTEGRGGHFERCVGVERGCSQADRSTLPETLRLRYVPGGEDVGVIFPFSRSGRPMLAKPAPALALATPQLEQIAARGRARVTALRRPVDLRRGLLPILAACARANLSAAGVDAAAGVELDSWLAAALDGPPSPPREGPLDELRRSLAVGAGTAPPDLSWALGQTWRTLYPAVVARLGGDRLAAPDWPAFRRLAAELERVSFGPPPVNAAKLIALIDAGRVDLTHLPGGRLIADRAPAVLRSARGEQGVDAVIDAVLPAPGASLGHSLLLRRLVDHGDARVAPGHRGIDVAPDGGCRRADGSTTPGLAAIGRPTEDSVIGNDTLSRTLHPLADLWARRVLARALGRGGGGDIAPAGGADRPGSLRPAR